MRDQQHLHEAVVDDLEERLQKVIAAPENEYRLGDLHGRLIAFALAEVISKDELDRFHDKLDAAGFESVRLSVRPEQSPQADGGKLLKKW